MADKEEKILLVMGNERDIDEFPYLFPWDKLDKTKRVVFNKSEAIEKMAKAINKERCRPALKEDIYWQEDKKELLREAEAALDALLSKEDMRNAIH